MNSSRHWSDGFFDAWYPHLFPLAPAARSDAEAEVLTRLLPEPPARVLDVACGEGRHAVRLAAAGYEVVGIDASQYLLGLARDAATRAAVSLSLHQMDMREMPFSGEFDAALNLFTAWGFFEDDNENQRALDRMAAALRGGASLIMEIAHRDAIVANYVEHDERRSEDGTLIWIDRQFDPVAGLNIVTHRWRGPDGSEGQRHHRIRLFTATEIDRMLRAAGLDPMDWFDGFGLEPLGLRSGLRLLVRARKR